MFDLDWVAIAAAVSIGLLIGVLLGPLRRRPLAQKALGSVWLALAWLAVVLIVRGDVSLSAPEQSFSKAILIFLSCNAAFQVIDLVVWDVVLNRRMVRGRQVSRLVMHVVGGLALLGAAMLALYNQFPDQARGILVTSTVVSAVLGLALQDVLGNVIGGLALEFEAPFHIGDWVRIGDVDGEVAGMNWRTTAILTRDNHIVYLTNGSVAKMDVVNLYRPERAEACDLFIGVAYDHAPGEVREVLLAAIRATPGVLAEPSPYVFVHEFGDFAIVYRLRLWFDDHWALPRTRDGVMTRAWYHLQRNGMGIPFPIRDVRLTAVPADAADLRAAKAGQAVIAALTPIDLFAELDAEQVARLAAASRRVTFARGERLFRQGDVGGPLFVIERGRVRVDVAGEDGDVVTVAQRSAGEHFGELGVLTGAPRTATIVAEEETVLVEVDHAAFAGLLRTDPVVAERLARVVAQRAEETTAQLAAARPAADEPRAVASLLARIRHVFGIG